MSACPTYTVVNSEVKHLATFILLFFNHRCLRTTARVWRKCPVSNDEVRRGASGADSCLLTEAFALTRLGWLGHVLLMPVHCLPFCALFARAR